MFKRALAAVAAVSVMCLLLQSPASAVFISPGAPLGYFDRFTYGGAVWNTKSFYLFDRTGNTFNSLAMQEFVNAWNQDLADRGLTGILPVIAYVSDSAHAGDCFNGSDSVGQKTKPQVAGAEYSYVLACDTVRSSGAPIPGFSRSSNPGRRHIRDFRTFPYAVCKSGFISTRWAPMTHDQLVRCWAHEVGHLMGFPHNDTQGHLMEGPNASGVYGLSWFSTFDFFYLEGIYPEMWQD